MYSVRRYPVSIAMLASRRAINSDVNHLHRCCALHGVHQVAALHAPVPRRQNRLLESSFSRCPGVTFIVHCNSRQRSWWATLTGKSFKCEDLTYDDVKRQLGDNSIVLVDCRNPNELEETGRIGQPINVPLPNITEAFSLPASGFQQNYGQIKPGKDADNIVIYCRSGVRALKAAEQMNELGYTQVKRYPGSWLEWAEKEELGRSSSN